MIAQFLKRLVAHDPGLPCLTRDAIAALDLLLELQNPIDQGFSSWRTAGNVNVDRNDPVTAAHHRVGVMIVASAIGAGSHRNHPAGFGHLVVYLTQRRRHLVTQCARDDHHVTLTRARTRNDAEAVKVVAW